MPCRLLSSPTPSPSPTSAHNPAHDGTNDLDLFRLDQIPQENMRPLSTAQGKGQKKIIQLLTRHGPLADVSPGHPD